MKNAFIAILVLTTIAVGYVAASSRLRMNVAALTGAKVKISRGDLTLPINATGEVEPFRRIVMKSEASGEVIDIAARPGEFVHKGDTIIRLQRDDEQRNVNRASLNVDVAKAAWEEAKSILEQARTADIAAAEAGVSQAEARLELSKLRASRAQERPDLYHDEERVQRATTYQSDKAQLEIAKANLQKTHLAIPRAEQAVVRAKANYETAKNNLGDAEKQLSKTTIVAPVDSIVSQINTQIGEVIQGGKQNFTGGTALAVLLDMEKLLLKAEVDEADIGRVLDLAPPWATPGHPDSQRMPDDLEAAAAQVDRPASIRVETFPDDVFNGVIERIYPEPRTINNVTTYLVDVVIYSKNRDKLLPGMRAEVEFTSQHLENVLLCPNEAIRTGPSGKFGVYVPRETSSPDELPTRFVPCKIGLTDGAHTEIKEGLQDGMEVYSKLPVQMRNSSRNEKGRG